MQDPLDNPDSVCGCSHLLRVHTYSCYQDMQKIMSLTGPMEMFPTGPAYIEWTCADCDCKDFRKDNLRYLEKLLDAKNFS